MGEDRTGNSTPHNCRTMSESWNNGFCGCCNMKGAGLFPCCIPNMCCFMPCMWASAMSQIKGKEADFGFIPCMLAAQCFPVCTFCYAYMKLKEHYGIDDPMWFLKPIFPILSYMQILDTILVKENLSMTPMFGLCEPDGPQGAPPSSDEMER